MSSSHVHRSSAGQVAKNIQVQNGNWLFTAIILILLAATVWSYWPTATTLFKDWQRDEDYSAGQLVPLVALLFLWVERKRLICMGRRSTSIGFSM